MKNLFPGYYAPDEDETHLQWKEGIFVFDANVLLNLYSLPEQAREDFLEILASLADRTWLPYQVMLEFHRNRNKRINFANRSVIELKDRLKTFLQTSREGFSAIEFQKRNTGISDIEKRLSDFDSSGQSLLDALDEACKKLNRGGLLDDIAPKLAVMYEGKIGLPPKDQDELGKLLDGADERFNNKIPPGFADLKDKTSVDYHGGVKYEAKYGDLIIWRQIIEYVSTMPNSRVIFVTAERKNDFWLKDEKGRIIGPLPELISEFLTKTKAKTFWLYHIDDFIREAAKRGKKAVSVETINEVRDISLKNDLIESLAAGDRLSATSTVKVNRDTFAVPTGPADGIALRFLAARYPASKPSRSNSGWLVESRGVEIYIQTLELDFIHPAAVLDCAKNIYETVLYSKVILLILCPVERWAGKSESSIYAVENMLRQIMEMENIDEIVIFAHDDAMSVMIQHEVKKI